MPVVRLLSSWLPLHAGSGTATSKEDAVASTRKRQPATRRRKTSPRARGGTPKRRPSPRKRGFSLTSLGEIEQRHLDLVGIALAALGVYLGFVLYGGWDGGQVGAAARVGLGYAVGDVRSLVPLLLVLGGAAIVLKPFIPSLRSYNVGVLTLVAGVLLAFAAETGGVGAGGPARHGQEFFTPEYFKAHGGAVGETLYWAAATLFQRVGAHILAIALIVAGGLLASGRSVASMLGRVAEHARARHEARTVALGGADAPTGLLETAAGETAANVTDLMEPDTAEDFVITQLNQPAEDEGAAADAPGGATAKNFDEQLYETDSDEAPADVDGTPPPPPPSEDRGRTPMGEARGVTTSEEVEYVTPPAKLLDRGKAEKGPDKRDQAAVAKKLVEALGHFGVKAAIVGTVCGPHVSRYELRLAPGTKVAKVAQLKDDLAYALASTDIRILAPIPGKQAVGVEVPNARRRLVRLGDIYQGRPEGSSPLVAWLGKDIAGNAIWTDISKMPHVLVAGTTGSGKSGCVNAILSSILMHASPNDVRLCLVDPKRVELNHYETVPHLLTPVVTAPRLAANMLNNLIGEMESRYGVMGEARARNLAELNRSRKAAGEAPLPHILCVIDELADLMMIAPAEVEDSIIRLAQKSRAVGIHLVLATQRPSTDIITGTIKVNIPARIAFAVSSQVDSRVILDQGGAEALLGQGDMLFRGAGTSKLQRIQGAFVGEDEIARIAEHWSRQGEPEFEQELLEARTEPESDGDEGDFDPDKDDLLDEAVRLVVHTQTASVSMIQRRLRVGYTRAGRLIDMLERRGVISGYEGSKPRQVLVNEGDVHRVLERIKGGGAEPEPEAARPPEPGTAELASAGAAGEDS
jgi:S-DNA-T family DNA segregation ATPase FtsK/SpoIIIE